MKIVKNDLFDYPNRHIYQLEDAFKFSLDSILLAEFVKIPNKECKILDMCSGNAAIPLIISLKTDNEIIGYEIQKDIYELAVKSVKSNNLENQIRIINDDVKNILKLFPGKYFDVIICNPPFFGASVNDYNKNDYLTIARHEVKINIADIFKIVNSHLKDNGSFYLVHRMERLDQIILEAEKYKMKIKELKIIVTKESKPKIILIRCQKHGKYGIKVGKIVNVNNLKTYQHIFEEE